MLARRGRSAERPRGYIRDWFAPRAASELLHLRGLIGEYENADVLRVVLARAARSARLTTHFDLDFPRSPQHEPYWCHKHRRTCRPVEERAHVHGDARNVELAGPYDGIVTSPPYPGLIDYHEQHRYAYELLGLDDRRERELGAAARGTSRAAIREYVSGISDVLRRCVDSLAPGLRSSSWSMTGGSSIPRSWKAPGCTSTSDSSATSTGGPGAAQGSTSSRSSSPALERPALVLLSLDFGE